MFCDEIIPDIMSESQAVLLLVKRKKKDQTLSYMYDKSSFTNRKFINGVTTQNATKNSITQRLQTDLGRSVSVTIVILLVWFKVFPDGLMDDMALKNISICTVSYAALPF